jgi:hypothetical protein
MAVDGRSRWSERYAADGLAQKSIAFTSSCKAAFSTALCGSPDMVSPCHSVRVDKDYCTVCDVPFPTAAAPAPNARLAASCGLH